MEISREFSWRSFSSIWILSYLIDCVRESLRILSSELCDLVGVPGSASVEYQYTSSPPRTAKRICRYLSLSPLATVQTMLTEPETISNINYYSGHSDDWYDHLGHRIWPAFFYESCAKAETSHHRIRSQDNFRQTTAPPARPSNMGKFNW